MENSQKWWGYLHNSGTIQAKRYFSQMDIKEAEESPFCRAIVGPFLANNRDEALSYVKEKTKYLNNHKLI